MKYFSEIFKKKYNVDFFYTRHCIYSIFFLSALNFLISSCCSILKTALREAYRKKEKIFTVISRNYESFSSQSLVVLMPTSLPSVCVRDIFHPIVMIIKEEE